MGAYQSCYRLCTRVHYRTYIYDMPYHNVLLQCNHYHNHNGYDVSIALLRYMAVITKVDWFPQRPENLENENGHGQIMKHEKSSKSHGIM